jgi:hypothetical protein
MVLPVKALEEAFGCIAGAAIESMKSLVFDILNSTVNNVERFVSCAAGSICWHIVEFNYWCARNLFESPLAGVAKLLQFFTDFNLGNILREGIGLLSEFGAGFACNQSLDNYKGLVNEWTVGGGPSGSVSSTASSLVGTYGNIRDITNIISSGVDINSVTQCFTGALQFASRRLLIFWWSWVWCICNSNLWKSCDKSGWEYNCKYHWSATNQS